MYSPRSSAGEERVRGGYDGAGEIDELEEEADAVVEGAAVGVGAGVRDGGEEVIEVAVGGVDLDGLMFCGRWLVRWFYQAACCSCLLGRAQGLATPRSGFMRLTWAYIEADVQGSLDGSHPALLEALDVGEGHRLRHVRVLAVRQVAASQYLVRPPVRLCHIKTELADRANLREVAGLPELLTR